MFYYKKYKKIVFSLHSQKQVFENRKQKLLPNITLYSCSKMDIRNLKYYSEMVIKNGYYFFKQPILKKEKTKFFLSELGQGLLFCLKSKS